MKTKEEIEQLAEEFLTFHQDGSKVYHIKIREAIEFAYNKCQQDMAEKKYTESQLRDAMEGAMVFSKLKQITEYIISLNKQD